MLSLLSLVQAVADTKEWRTRSKMRCFSKAIGLSKMTDRPGKGLFNIQVLLPCHEIKNARIKNDLNDSIIHSDKFS